MFVFCALLLTVVLFVFFGLCVCLFVCFFFSGVRKTPALLSKRTVFFLLTAVSKQELLHLCFHR